MTKVESVKICGVWTVMETSGLYTSTHTESCVTQPCWSEKSTDTHVDIVIGGVKYSAIYTESVSIHVK